METEDVRELARVMRNVADNPGIYPNGFITSILNAGADLIDTPMVVSVAPQIQGQMTVEEIIGSFA